MFIDTHCHLSNEYYENLDEVINENIRAGIKYTILSGCDKKSIDESIKIINNYDFVYATIGYHPDQADVIKERDIKILQKKILSNKKVIGIGEIGLDYHYEGISKEKQQWLFEEQLNLAQKLDIPVVIHSRDATFDTINILKKYNLKGIIHCFSGSLETAKEYIKMGYLLGIGGIVTFKNSKLDYVVENLEIDNIVLETDSPFLTPEPFRGKKNSSKYIPIIAEKISNIKKIDISEVSSKTNQNCYDLFDLNI